jgi:hypothetical protein
LAVLSKKVIDKTTEWARPLDSMQMERPPGKRILS